MYLQIYYQLNYNIPQILFYTWSLRVADKLVSLSFGEKFPRSLIIHNFPAYAICLLFPPFAGEFEICAIINAGDVNEAFGCHAKNERSKRVLVQIIWIIYNWWYGVRWVFLFYTAGLKYAPCLMFVTSSKHPPLRITIIKFAQIN